jgi:ligand-binding sensor domain-containing protein
MTKKTLLKPLCAFILSFFVLTHSQGLFAQINAVSFDYLKINDSGLDAPISSIYRDSKGYMWFGNNDPRTLFQFDGYDYKKYKNNPEDPRSISHESVFSFCEDKSGSLWISTFSGLNRFNRKDATFDRLYLHKVTKKVLTGNFLLRAGFDHENTLWVKEAVTGIFTRKNSEKHFRPLIFDKDYLFNIVPEYVSYLYLAKSGKVWFSTDNARNSNPVLYCYNSKNKKYTSFAHIPDESSSLNWNNSLNFFEDSHEKLWIMLFGGGIRPKNA